MNRVNKALIQKKAWFFFLAVFSITTLSLAFSDKGMIKKKEFVPVKLAGFEKSSFLNEQIKVYSFDTDVTIQINAPAAEVYDVSKPTHLIFFALPNGNSTEQTIGKRLKIGDDWHFDIQHIGAQVRRLREVIKDENIVVAYLEAKPRSWPNYRARHADNPKLIAKMVQSVIDQLPSKPETIDLSSHSGGGSLLFGFINNADHIPDWLNRFVFLDSVYAYDTEFKHGDKWIDWLKQDPKHVLSIISYDDREIMLNGKKVLGPTGGTYRATHRILDRLGQDIPLSVQSTAKYERWRGMGGQVDIIVYENPENKILHTILVGEMSGFIYSATVHTPYEDKVAIFDGPITYKKWIQE